MEKIITFSKSNASYLARRLNEATNDTLKPFFVAAGAVYNKERGVYSINGIEGLSTDEMLEIYLHKEAIDNLDLPQALQGCTARTIIPCRQAVGIRLKHRPLNGEKTFADSSVQVLKFGNGQTLDCTNESEILPAEKLEGTFAKCRALHTIYPINLANASNVSCDAFEDCVALREVRLYRLGHSVSFAQSPLISYNSLLYALVNCNGAGIDIAVHPTTYKYLLAVENAPSTVGGTGKEWAGLLNNGAKKGINFITGERFILVDGATLCINNVTANGDTLDIGNGVATVNEETVIFN